MRHFLFNVLICLGLVACGTTGNQSQHEIIPVALHTRTLGDTSLLLGCANQILWRDSVVYLWDMKGEQHLKMLSYPDLRLISSFCQRGKGPEEMVGVVGFDILRDELFVLADRYPKVLVFSLSRLNRGETKPLRIIELPAETMPAFAFALTDDGRMVLSGTSQTDRITVVDTVGRLVAHPEVSYPASPKELKIVDEGTLPYLWYSAMDCDGDRLVIATRLGEVIERHYMAVGAFDSLWVTVGDDGIPTIDKEGTIGQVDGFSQVRIVGQKIYACYSGVKMTEISRQLDEGGTPPTGGKELRVYDLETGKLQRIYELDRHISSFDILPDGRTVIATDPNSERQLCTFTIPE